MIRTLLLRSLVLLAAALPAAAETSGPQRTAADDRRVALAPSLPTPLAVQSASMDITAVTDASVSRFVEAGAEGLSANERLLVALWGLEADLNNGGLSQYYFNSYGNFASELPQRLRDIGAAATAKALERANALFGAGGPSPDRDKRQKQLEALGDDIDDEFAPLQEELLSYPDDFWALAAKYLEKTIS